MEVSVVGLGRLGAAFAASVARSGISVSGVDIDTQRVEQLDQNSSTFEEPKMTECLKTAGDSLYVTTDFIQAVKDTDITFIFVNTYDENESGYSLHAVESAARDIGQVLADDDSPHLVVIRSTVMPGDSRSRIVEWLEEDSGRTVGEDIMLCYWPEFTALGRVIDSMEQPEYRVIGEHTETAGDQLETFIQQWQPDALRTVRTDILNAEVIKMALNGYIAMKLSFVNQLGRICDGIGANVDSVTEAMANDERISGDYFCAGVRYGGPCFPHDNVAFEQLANMAGTTAPLAQAADKINHEHTEWIGNIAREMTRSDGTVAVLGLAYKPEVPVIQESQGIELVSYLNGLIDVTAYDPLDSIDTSKLPDDVNMPENIEDAVTTADTAILTVSHEKLVNESVYKDITLIDPWRVFNPDRLHKTVTYRPLGE